MNRRFVGWMGLYTNTPLTALSTSIVSCSMNITSVNTAVLVLLPELSARKDENYPQG